jgi:hypothetical protein
MTTTEQTASREVSRRAGALMAASDSLTWDQAVATATAQVEAEAAARADAEAHTQAFVDSFERMAGGRPCALCGKPRQPGRYIGVTERERLQGHSHGFRDHFCPACAYVVAAEYERRLAAEDVGGNSRGQSASDYLDRRAKAG